MEGESHLINLIEIHETTQALVLASIQERTNINFKEE